MRVGDGADARVLLVRVNDEAVLARLRDRLGDAAVESPDAHPAISVKVGGPRGPVRDLHVVHRLGFEVAKVRSVDDALDVAVGLLATFRPRPEGTIVVNARVLERDGSAVLVTDNFVHTLDGHERRLAAAGYTVGRVTPVAVDPITAEVLVPDGVGADASRRVPVSHVVAFAPPDDPTATPAQRMLDVMMLVSGRGEPIRGTDVAGLAVLLDRVPLVRVDALLPQDVSPVLLGLR